jgi:coenzyme F420-reducing hydrogenase beta subunit
MDPQFGPLKGFFLGRAIDSQIHSNGASGGVATSLLLYLLEAKEVDAVAVVDLKNGYPVAKITDDPKEIIASARSKYSPAPVVEHVIKALKNDSRKIAITVIPCQLAALHYAIAIDRKLAEKIVVTVGLFCGHLKAYEAVARIANTLSLECRGDPKFLGWRCGRWPGVMRFKLRDGSFRDRPLQSWINLLIPYYALHRCLMCPSRENWLADLALADNHVGATSDTVIVARTEKGRQLLCHAAEKGFIQLVEKRKDQAEKFVTRTKFIPALSYICWRKKRKLPVPIYDYDENSILSQVSWRAKYACLLKYRMFIGVRKEAVMRFLTARPALMEAVGAFLNKFPFSMWGAWFLARFLKKLSSVIREVKYLSDKFKSKR